MRKTFVTTIFILVAAICNGQFYKTLLPTPEFTNALEKIVLDYRLNYKTIQGEQIIKEGNIETYNSLIKIPGAKDCLISYFNSKADTTASWQAVMYSGENYRQAVQAYENLFRLVKKSRVKWIDRSLVGFIGEMEKPKEEIGFTVSTLRFDLDDKRYQNFLVEIEMVPAGEGWDVRLNIYSKSPDNQG